MLNINVGVLGHVDSGKTSLAKVLSTIASTSAFDKNPQSKKRGITLDLGFSSFTVDSAGYPFTPSIRENFEKVQFTLVDCPGHGSLIKTVLCGSQIIDIVVLVIDVTKGFQTQTAECLVIGEIACEKMLVVLNKCDLLNENQRDESIQKMKKRILKTLENTIFKQSEIAEISAAPEFTSEQRVNNSQEVENLITLLARSIHDPTEKRNKLKDMGFVFAVDHCFTITGQGTILTGTVLSGTTSVGQTIGLPYQRIQKKIKSIQRFRQPIQSIVPGDRAGICVPQLDSNLLERGLVGDITSTDNLIPCYACILSNVKKVSYYKLSIKSQSRLHIFIGQETVLSSLTFFTKIKLDNHLNNPCEFDKTIMYQYIDEISNEIGVPYRDESAVQCFQVCKSKTRRGQLERIVNPRMCIVNGLFKRETNWDIFIGLRAYLIIKSNEDSSSNDNHIQRIYGYIESSFGQSGKCRLALENDLPDEILAQYSSKAGRKQISQPDIEVILEFKKNIFDPQRRVIQ
ncbi:selenocysteine-specific elongation factor,putative [Schistosoma mansoni]|uniref:selenocysteine-specific elongation factor,putative n=1 Tax=Schistosoma mansoni TaxID=6183 RepID=UPI00022C862A|nr:selenocysteine-specific elongation factor,putative [Schistosoma mansoni]|eukprot:XP_018645086.1 selenocysteine-specific elongation factor,putative [Schistosoma mansoni]